MNILIKSYNRPYLLEYTIKSIFKNIKGDFKITIVDDGTPDVFLKKITAKFPMVNLKKTKFYEEKTNLINNYELNNVYTEIVLPHSEWNQAVNEFDTDFFLVLEDDQFIIEEIDIDFISELFNKFDLQFLHFNVLNRKKFSFKIPKQQDGIFIYNSKYLLRKIKEFNSNFNQSFFKKIKDKIFLKFKINSFNIDFKNDILELYNIYVISGVVYRKKYWNICTDTSNDVLNENYQIYCAGNYNLLKKGKLNFGATIKQVIKTTLNNTSIGLNRGTDFDPTLFNILMNKKWYLNDQNYFDETNYELNEDYIYNYLKQVGNPNCSPNEWIKFTDLFNKCYKDLGFEL